MILAKEAATKNIEHGFDRRRFRRKTRQFKLLPITPTTRRHPNVIVKYPCIILRIVIVDDIL